jgi:predicted negative regulator of RcsB-dependent stress response
MSEQLTDEEQVELLKKWWKENGTAIIVGIVIGLGAIIGFWNWTKYQEDVAKNASVKYDEFLTALVDNKADASGTFELLKKDYEGTSYAALAALRMAAEEYKKADVNKAMEHLQWAVQHPGHDSILHVSRVRLARLLVSQDKLDEAEKLLTGVKEPAFDAQYSSIRGDIYSKQGKIDEARSAYQLALGSESFSGKQREYVQMKLNELGAKETTGPGQETDK